MTVTQSLTGLSPWAYSIVRPIANSYKHWKRITSVSTLDMDVSNFTISVPHYFDTERPDGDLVSYAPHTDAKDDVYTKRFDYGQWTLEIEDPRNVKSSQNLTNFLNVFTLGDNKEDDPVVTPVKGESVSGVIVGNRLVIFANKKEKVGELSFECPANGVFDALIMNLNLSTNYYITYNNATVTVSTSKTSTQHATTTNMGVLKINITCQTATKVPDRPMNLRVGI